MWIIYLIQSCSVQVSDADLLNFWLSEYCGSSAAVQRNQMVIQSVLPLLPLMSIIGIRMHPLVSLVTHTRSRSTHIHNLYSFLLYMHSQTCGSYDISILYLLSYCLICWIQHGHNQPIPSVASGRIPYTFTLLYLVVPIKLSTRRNKNVRVVFIKYKQLISKIY